MNPRSHQPRPSRSTFFFSSAGVLGLSGAANPPQTVAITGIRLIDGTGSAPIDDAVLVVSEGRIAAAGPRASVTVPPGAQAVSLAGKPSCPR